MPDRLSVSQDNWEAHWQNYAASATCNPAQQMRHEIIARLLCENGRKSGMRLLDLGSGQGDLARTLTTSIPEAEFVGVELSETGVAISRKKAPTATFVEADVLRRPAALKQFTGWATHAVCSEVLEHVDDSIGFLEQARLYLAEGGRLIVTVPGGPMSAFDRHIGHRQHFTRATIRAILERAGYAVDRVYRAGFPFFNLYRLVVIVRGKRLAQDVESQAGQKPGWLTGFAMKVFAVLFRGNLLDSPFGWQLIATARKASK